MSNDFANLEAPTVQTQVDPQTAKLGDLVQVNIRVTHVPALSVDNPALAKTVGTFEVFGSTRLPVVASADQAMERFQIALQNFTTGPQLLPGIDIPYRDPLGKEHLVRSSSFTVMIEEMPAGPKDKGDIRGLKGVIGPTAWSPWWWAVLAVIMIAAGATYWQKRRRAMQGPPPPPPIPADITALDKLKALAATDWIATGKLKEFYSAVSEIVRAYIEDRFNTPALERTTNELMRDLHRRSEVPADLQGELRDLLDACDLVKFAKFRPDADEAMKAHQSAVTFVEKTKSPEEDNELR